MEIHKAGFIERVTTDVTKRGFRVSSPVAPQPATGWHSDLNILIGDEWVVLFVVTDIAQLENVEWLRNRRRYTPGPPAPFALISLVSSSSKSKVGDAPVFDFSDYEEGMGNLDFWLGQLNARQSSEGTGGIPDAGGIRRSVPIEEMLHRFTFSAEAKQVMEFAPAMASLYQGGGAVLLGEVLMFAVAECGMINPESVPGFFWRILEQSDENGYVITLEQYFPQWDRAVSDRTVRMVSANTMDILAGAALIARRTSGETSISAWHLIAALYVVRPSAPGAETAANFAHSLGMPDVRKPVLDYVRSMIATDNPTEWEVVLARVWTVEELAADRTLGISAASLSDRVATRDQLGFEPYVNAVAAFVTNPETQAPLTLAVEGEWGSGKSSFMRQVEACIHEEAGGTKPAKPNWFRRLLAVVNPWHDPGPMTVWFNPWRHDREEALWAAFALEFLRNISRQLPFARRWRGHLKLLHTRFSWHDGGWDVLRFVALIAFAVALLVSLLTRVLQSPDLTALLKATGMAGVVALFASLVKEVKSFVGNPFRVELKQFVRSPDYQGRISFIEQFHRDFGKMVEAYAGGRKVYVFIDDLDRCQVPRAADLMQALNLMIAEEQPLVFIIGMDREKIAASLAVKFKEVIPYMGGTGPLAEAPWAHAETAAGLEFGSEFLEKFVQVSIRVPQPRERDITRLLEGLSPGGAGAPPKPTAGGAAAGAVSGPAKRDAVFVTPLTQAGKDLAVGNNTGDVRNEEASRAPADVDTRRAMRRSVSVDSPRLHDIVRLVAPALDYNPRRVKQFINACRLQAYIAIETGLIAEEGTGAPSDLTFEKLGKFVAITLRWPLLAAHLEDEPDLLERLEATAVGTSISAVPIMVFWASKPRLMELLRAGLLDREGLAWPDAYGTYAFKGVDIAQLLRVTTGSPVGAVRAQGAEPVAARQDARALVPATTPSAST
jgi:hypothetical protein